MCRSGGKGQGVRHTFFFKAPPPPKFTPKQNQKNQTNKIEVLPSRVNIATKLLYRQLPEPELEGCNSVPFSLHWRPLQVHPSQAGSCSLYRERWARRTPAGVRIPDLKFGASVQISPFLSQKTSGEALSVVFKGPRNSKASGRGCRTLLRVEGSSTFFKLLQEMCWKGRWAWSQFQVLLSELGRPHS